MLTGPNVEKKMLEPLTNEEWVSELPFQSHRLKAAWGNDRSAVMQGNVLAPMVVEVVAVEPKKQR